MPQPHNKVILSFNNENGRPASTGIVVASAAPISSATGLQAWATAIAAYCSASTPAALRALMSVGTSLVSVKTTYQQGNLQVAAGQASLATAAVGTGTSVHPPQVACVFSLITGLTGRSYRGRCYWPATGATLDAGGAFTVVLATLATAFDTLIKVGIAQAAGAPPSGVAAVYSVTKDVTTPLTSIRVGNGPDTQRRRKSRTESTGSVSY
jgi:hypothetical protein